MNLSLRFSAIVLSVLAIFSPDALAKAPTPEQVAARAVTSINAVVPGAQRQFTSATTATTNAINRLDQAGKPAAAIEQAGARGTQRITTVQTTNTNQVNRRRDAAVRLLTRMNADAALIQQVNDAASAATASIVSSADASKSAIAAAVAAALAS